MSTAAWTSAAAAAAASIQQHAAAAPAWFAALAREGATTVGAAITATAPTAEQTQLRVALAVTAVCAVVVLLANAILARKTAGSVRTESETAPQAPSTAATTSTAAAAAEDRWVLYCGVCGVEVVLDGEAKHVGGKRHRARVVETGVDKPLIRRIARDAADAGPDAAAAGGGAEAHEATRAGDVKLGTAATGGRTVLFAPPSEGAIDTSEASYEDGGWHVAGGGGKPAGRAAGTPHAAGAADGDEGGSADRASPAAGAGEAAGAGAGASAAAGAGGVIALTAPQMTASWVHLAGGGNILEGLTAWPDAVTARFQDTLLSFAATALERSRTGALPTHTWLGSSAGECGKMAFGVRYDFVRGEAVTGQLVAPPTGDLLNLLRDFPKRWARRAADLPGIRTKTLPAFNAATICLLEKGMALAAHTYSPAVTEGPVALLLLDNPATVSIAPGVAVATARDADETADELEARRERVAAAAFTRQVLPRTAIVLDRTTLKTCNIGIRSDPAKRRVVVIMYKLSAAVAERARARGSLAE